MSKRPHGNHPCRHCGQPVPSRFVYHKQCLDTVRRSFDYRTFALARDGRVCNDCPAWRNRAALALADKMGRARRVDVDHIEPLGAGGANEPQNLQVLCKHHHRVKTRTDIAKMCGTYVGLLRRPGALLALGIGLYILARLVRILAGAATETDLAGAITLAGVVCWSAVPITLAVLLRRRTLARLRNAVLEVTQDSATKRRTVIARRWRLVRIPGLPGRRLRPTDIEVRYPHTFPDHDPRKQAELEARIEAKMGGTWYARWNTAADRARFRSPDPLVGLGGVPWPNAGAPHLSLWDPIPVGPGEDGQPVTMSLIEKNLLIGGEPGAGKSVSQGLVVATCALDKDVVLYGIDGKRVELARWAPVMERLVFTRADAIALLDDLIAVMEFRYELLLSRGKVKIERGDGLDLHVLIIDELAQFTSTGLKKERDDFTERLRDLISRGRAAGIIVVMATQRPSADIVPTAVRDLVGYRWALRTSTPASSDMILGAGQASAGYSSARVAASTRGIGFLYAEGATPVRLRSYLIDDHALESVVARAAALRRGQAPAMASESDQP